MTISFAAGFFKLFQEIVDALLPFVFGDQIQFVQDEPAGFLRHFGEVTKTSLGLQLHPRIHRLTRRLGFT